MLVRKVDHCKGNSHGLRQRIRYRVVGKASVDVKTEVVFANVEIEKLITSAIFETR